MSTNYETWTIERIGTLDTTVEGSEVTVHTFRVRTDLPRNIIAHAYGPPGVDDEGLLAAMMQVVLESTIDMHKEGTLETLPEEQSTEEAEGREEAAVPTLA